MRHRNGATLSFVPPYARIGAVARSSSELPKPWGMGAETARPKTSASITRSFAGLNPSASLTSRATSTQLDRFAVHPTAGG
jgi:hypothetical protein